MKNLALALCLTLAAVSPRPSLAAAPERVTGFGTDGKPIPVTVIRDLSTLPPAVHATYARLLKAAETGTLAALLATMEANKDDPQVTFGGQTGTARDFIRSEYAGKKGAAYVATLKQYLSLPAGFDGTDYFWPYWFNADLKKLDKKHLAEVLKVTPNAAKTENYYGWRVLIEPSGKWTAFIEGD
jgi:hypothetical protein